METDTPPRKSRTRKRWTLFIVLLALSGAAAWKLIPRSPQFRDVAVVSLEFKLEGTEAPFQVPDAKVANTIFQMLRSARSVANHKCAAAGHLRLAYVNGSTQVVEVLPGHDLAYYEIRHQDQSYRMPRADFFWALKQGGVDTATLPSLD